MLPRKRRIPRKLFGKILHSGKKTNTRHFFLLESDSSEARFAVSVSKKVAKGASVRNLIRRRAYSLVQKFIPGLPHKLFLITAKPGAEKLRGKALERELAELLLKR